MTTKNKKAQKKTYLQQLIDTIELHIKRDYAEPIVYKGKLPKRRVRDGYKPPAETFSPSGVKYQPGPSMFKDLIPEGGFDFKLDTERETERQIHLERKYAEMADLAIHIWETYPGCSEPPVGNSKSLAGLRELLVWARKEFVGTVKPGITQKEANQKLRKIFEREVEKIKKTGHLPKIEDLAKEIGCSNALLYKCSFMATIREMRRGLRKGRKPKEVKLTKKILEVRSDKTIINPADQAEQSEQDLDKRLAAGKIAQLRAESQAEEQEESRRFEKFKLSKIEKRTGNPIETQ